MINCTVSNNSAGRDGGGIWSNWCFISNSVIWGNEASGEEPTYIHDPFHQGIDHSCIEHWTPEGEGCISTDPFFAAGPLGDYYLSCREAGQDEDSPCIDAGASEAGMARRTTRTDHIPDTGMIDMGYRYSLSEEIDVEVTCSLSADEFAPGDALQGSLGIENRDGDVVVDLFTGFLLPDGSMLSYMSSRGFMNGEWYWYSDLILPSGFSVDPSVIFELTLPAHAVPGNYVYLAAITNARMGGAGILAIDEWPFQIVSGSGITMVPIPAGSFLMGSPDYEEGRWDDEGRQRTVNISAFQMSETEVTQKQWQDAMGWNDSYFSSDDHPVEQVTWYDCVSFCNELSNADGYTKCYTIANIGYDGDHITWADVKCSFEANGYRLPTEAEWEYACRAGTTTRFYTADSDSDLDRAGWFYGNSGSTTHSVGENEPNAWGLYDMHGNVWEWCWDWYLSGYYGSQPDPDSDPTGPSSGSYRVRRGGCWNFSPRYCRSASRSGDGPYYRGSYGGFRLVRSVR
ncbi:MAG: formylglycine-generating enzyme family protein [Candidatus Coatesbacteria bacterium]|nr:formylglycine-generating enzyme family protein [Candidatus Coatesbacteria bacterium]